jgi:hypothetical protein
LIFWGVSKNFNMKWDMIRPAKHKNLYNEYEEDRLVTRPIDYGCEGGCFSGVPELRDNFKPPFAFQL